MPYWPESPAELSSVNPDHIGLLTDGLRAPSAHNAQPWQIKPLDDGRTYEFHYNQHADLPEDHDDKDAYLTMGALVETTVLQAPNHNLTATVTPELTRIGNDLFIARVALDKLVEGSEIDPLSQWIGARETNRMPYQKDPLPAELTEQLEAYGNAVVPTELLEEAVLEASIRAWGSPRFVDDLKKWFRKDEQSPDGLSAELMQVGRLGGLAVDFAAKRGGFKSKLMKWLYSSSEMDAFKSAPVAAVLTAPDMSPPALFDAGRRLLRSWVAINEAGFSYQPFSVAVDDRITAPKVAEIAGVPNAVALYRVGKATKPMQHPSNRKPLSEVIIT